MPKTLKAKVEVKAKVLKENIYFCSEYCEFIDLKWDGCNLFGASLISASDPDENLGFLRCRKCLKAFVKGR